MNFFKDYRLGEKIGSGGFSEVYRCTHETGHAYAIKIEKPGKKSLKNEYEIIKQLNREANPFICMAYEYGIITSSGRHCMVMELLGDNLSATMSKHGVFGEKNLLNVALMMLNAIEYLHERGYVHRDIKPENFAFSMDEQRLYLMDFGLAKQISKLKYREGKPLIGTARYASIHAHAGIEISRRDDLESMLYSIVFVAKGRLPWQGIQMSSKAAKHLAIKNKKRKTPISELCEGLPQIFELILISCSYLEFEERPNYAYYRMLITDRLREGRYPVDKIWNWEARK